MLSTGLVYSYLAGHVGHRTNCEGAFRALKRGYAHWASGRLARIDVNVDNPEYCHVRATTKASMKPVSNNVGLLLKKTKPLTNIIKATCQCAASVSVLLYQQKISKLHLLMFQLYFMHLLD